MNLIEFVRESNRIERIMFVRLVEVEAHRQFLDLERLTVPALCEFVKLTADARLRNQTGLDIIVTGAKHVPPPGGSEIEQRLNVILESVNSAARDPYIVHCEYESLHPFTDGNGRSGRALWAWHMQRLGSDPFELPFLQHFYYQALDASPWLLLSGAER